MMTRSPMRLPTLEGPWGRLLATLLLITVIAIRAQAVSAEEQPLPAAQQQAIERAVRDYLRENPDVLIEAIQILQARQREGVSAQAKNVIAARGSEIFDDPESPVGGNPDGDVTLVEFFDYRCGYCKRVFPTVQKLLNDDGNIRFVYKEFPVLGPPSVYAARAALASREQGRYREFHDAMMGAEGALTEDRVLAIAESVGLDRGALLNTMSRNETEHEGIISRNMELARSLAINGTPAFVAGDVVIRGAAGYESMKEVVAQARSKQAGENVGSRR